MIDIGKLLEVLDQDLRQAARQAAPLKAIFGPRNLRQQVFLALLSIIMLQNEGLIIVSPLNPAVATNRFFLFKFFLKKLASLIDHTTALLDVLLEGTISLLSILLTIQGVPKGGARANTLNAATLCVASHTRPVVL